MIRFLPRQRKGAARSLAQKPVTRCLVSVGAVALAAAQAPIVIDGD
jgi:hypothetical protein